MSHETIASTPLPGALCLHDCDDVAVMRAAGRAGDVCEVVCDQAQVALRLATDVPFGHKVSMRGLCVGATVRKYGQPIGVVVEPIPAGAHLHVHNLRGLDKAASNAGR